MSKEHFSNLKRIYSDEGLTQAAKYDFDKSFIRHLIPYAAEMIPGVFGVKNYQAVMGEAETETSAIEVMKKSIVGAVSLGSEAARYIITAVTYNETKSPQAAIAAYVLSTSILSFRNSLRVDRFYKPRNKELTDRL